MKIKEISWRNVASYGNNLQKIVFEEDQGNFFLVVGSNGAGKSTISDVIKFGLYGKLDNKKLGDIANRFNGNAYVRIELEKNSSTKIVIERGIAPGIFRVFINGAEYQQAGKKNVQSFLEEELLEIPYYVFNNMVSLSINDFKSFIGMSPNDKRGIIDRLFGLEILGHVRWRLKMKIKDLKEQMDNIGTEINVLARSIDTSNTELDTLNEKLKVATADKKDDLTEKITKLKAFIEAAGEHIKKITLAETEVKNTISGLRQTKSSIEYEKKTRDTKIHLFQQGKCPTCESDLTTDYHKNMLQEYLSENEEAITEIHSLDESVKTMDEKKSLLLEKLREVEKKKLSAGIQLHTASGSLTQLTTVDNTDEQTSSLKNIIDEAEKNKTAAINRKDQEDKKANFYRIVEEIFGDKGVKLMAVKRILPILNTEMKKVLIDLGMDYRVTFNEEFEVTILHLGYQVSADQLSTGERKKVDFAALIALIRIMKMRFAGINLFFLDEIFSSIDTDGIHHILKVLHKTCRELNLNIFVINHSQLPTEIFDYRLEITKNNGFSNLTIEKIQ
jgi:DNA repair exonuclease SbcCD ATPase subunit